jgi:ATP-dependent DNA ligase
MCASCSSALHWLGGQTLVTAVHCAFDLLELLDGEDLCRHPIGVRKALLAAHIPKPQM